MPSNFFTWYFANQIPTFLKKRSQSLASTVNFFNFAGLLKNLFTPYRRIYVEKDAPQFGVSGLLDRIAFNVISRIIGAFARLFLIFVGIISFTVITIFNMAFLFVWILIPPLSIPAYLKITSGTFLPKDLENGEDFVKKLKETQLFKLTKLFFGDDFETIFEKIRSRKPPVKNSGLPAQILLALAKNYPPLGSYLDSKEIKNDAFNTLVVHLQAYLEFSPHEALTPIGQILAFGYTKTLDRFGKRITGLNMFLSDSEKQALNQIEKILTRNQNNNVLLVGEPGVGRHATIENLACAISTSTLPNLSAKQLVYLDVISLAGTGKSIVEVKSNFESVILESKNAGNIILVIDQIDRILSSKDERIDLSEVFSQVLRENVLPIIGITTPDDFNVYIRTNPQVLKLFEKIEIDESTPLETLGILITKSLNYYSKDKIESHLEALIEIIERSNELLADRRQPEKALILLEEALSEAKNQGQRSLTVVLVDQLLSQKTNTPIGKIGGTEASKLKDLESVLHKRIIGQEEAIAEIAKAMRRARTEIEITPKPIGSFLMLGPTGVGKTETAKALAESYFGNENKMVRLDMSEFQGNDAMPRLIGDIATKSPGILTTRIRENPYGILLLDEFEKANPSIHNLFLQVLDEGFLTDAFGKKVSFSNVIIIATSNAGAEFIREEVQKGETDLSRKLTDHVLEKSLFSPELINRFDGVIIYHPLVQEEIVKITTLMLTNLSKKLKESKNITLEVTADLAKKVAEEGYDQTFGARPIKRLIQDKIEDEIAKMIIEEKVKNGDTISASALLGFI